MADQEDVRRIALALPGTQQDGSAYRIRGKLFAWVYPQRVHPRKAREPNPDVECVRVTDESEKQILLEAEPRKFFTTEHYQGHPIVMVRLPEIGVDELTELITDAWRSRGGR